MATRTRGRSQKKYWKETVIVTAVHEYCNVDLHPCNLIFVLVAYEAVSHWFYTTERGQKKGEGGFERLEQVFLFCFCVADYRRYNLYFIVCSNLAMSERLLSGRFTKEQTFSGADNFKNTKAPFQTPHLWQTWCHKYVLDHTYPLPNATQPNIIENEPFSIYSEIEIDTEVDAV
jgi:hypothetical protein